MKKVFTCLMFLSLVAHVRGQVSNCQNLDFEMGSLATWIVPDPGYATITSGSGVDPIGNFPVVAPGGNHSVSIVGSSPGFGKYIDHPIDITAANSILSIRVAGHFGLTNQIPYDPAQLWIEVFYLAGETYACDPIKLDEEVTDLRRPSGSNYGYIPWTTYLIDLSAYVGERILVRLTAVTGGYTSNNDINYLNVRGYFDFFCSPPPLTTVNNICPGTAITLSAPFETELSESLFNWDMGDGTTYTFFTNTTFTHTYSAPGVYTISLKYRPPSTSNCVNATLTHTITVDQCDQPPGEFCEICIPSFSPLPGEKYIVQAWAKEGVGIGKHTYEHVGISFDFGQGTVTPVMRPSGMIIDGWQRIEGEFVVPNDAASISVSLHNEGDEEVFFDDVRIQPFNSSFKTFVYDPVTLKMTAILDERNFATFYEYDEEGALTRTKQETERGILTTSEVHSGMHNKSTAP